MIKILKKNWQIIGVATITVTMAIVAIVTASKLYERKPVAPNAPKPAPAASEACRLSFTLSAPSPTATAAVTTTPTVTSTPPPGATTTPRPTATSTPRPTATLTPAATPTNTPAPRNTNTPTPNPTATPTPRPQATSTPQPTVVAASQPTKTPTQTKATATPTTVQLPEAGSPIPTLGFVIAGIVLLGIALLLAI